MQPDAHEFGPRRDPGPLTTRDDPGPGPGPGSSAVLTRRSAASQPEPRMSSPMKAVLRGVLPLALAVVVGGCAGAAPAAPPPTSNLTSPAPSAAATTQRDDAGAVTIEAAWRGASTGAVFDVALDTHSVDLDALDLADATLRNDRGDVLDAEPWQAPKGGHHREGTLTFAGDAAGFFAGARWFELVLVGLGDTPQRVLRWTPVP